MSDIEELLPEEVRAAAEQPAPEPPQGRFALLKEALRGSSLDYTQGPVGRALLMLAIPMVLETAL